jgi:hypothetical protein
MTQNAPTGAVHGYVYDAFNRLAQLKDGSTVVSSHRHTPRPQQATEMVDGALQAILQVHLGPPAQHGLGE